MKEMWKLRSSKYESSHWGFIRRCCCLPCRSSILQGPSQKTHQWHYRKQRCATPVRTLKQLTFAYLGCMPGRAPIAYFLNKMRVKPSLRSSVLELLTSSTSRPRFKHPLAIRSAADRQAQPRLVLPQGGLRQSRPAWGMIVGTASWWRKLAQTPRRNADHRPTEAATHAAGGNESARAHACSNRWTGAAASAIQRQTRHFTKHNIDNNSTPMGSGELCVSESSLARRASVEATPPVPCDGDGALRLRRGGDSDRIDATLIMSGCFEVQVTDEDVGGSSTASRSGKWRTEARRRSNTLRSTKSRARSGAAERTVSNQAAKWPDCESGRDATRFAGMCQHGTSHCACFYPMGHEMHESKLMGCPRCVMFSE